MKTKNIILILASTLLAGCISTGPKSSTSANIDPAAGFFSSEEFTQLDQIKLSVESGLTCTNKLDSKGPVCFVVDGSPKQQQLTQIISRVDYNRRDMSLIDTAPLPPVNVDSLDKR